MCLVLAPVKNPFCKRVQNIVRYNRVRLDYIMNNNRWSKSNMRTESAALIRDVK